MFSEHGLLGLGALILLLFSAVDRFVSARGPVERGIVAMLYAWSLLFMLVTGMRVVAPSFIFGLACAMPPSSRRAIGERPGAPSRFLRPSLLGPPVSGAVTPPLR